MNESFRYVASPYSFPDSEIRQNSPSLPRGTSPLNLKHKMSTPTLKDRLPVILGISAAVYGLYRLLTRDSTSTKLYGPTHRALQSANDTVRLADLLEKMSRPTFADSDKQFIESANMLFISTVDGKGMPTVSYKGGSPGFVRCTSPNTLMFPLYDGNGMYLSSGNILASGKVGLLFIDFEKPKRLRAQGTATYHSSGPLLNEFPGAQQVIVVNVESLYVNCGRYIHKNACELSPHVPNSKGEQPIAGWKRIDVIEGTLSANDRKMVEKSGGTVPIDKYTGEDEPDLATIAVQKGGY
jgi:predicted pyridoxine 5'-phosphate oxidase superfamily flavin-nucleotide-binding protein